MNEYFVILNKLCNCLKKREISKVTIFKTQKEAKDYAEDLTYRCNENLCGKHFFEITEVNSHFVISVEDNSFNEPCEI